LIFFASRGKNLSVCGCCELSAELNQLANDKPWFLHVTWNKMEEYANDFVIYVLVSSFLNVCGENT
jgi:hypothetical protein